MPISLHAVTVSRMLCMLARCPSIRGRPRCFAHRPLPSIITAMCRGSRVKSRRASSSASFSCSLVSVVVMFSARRGNRSRRGYFYLPFPAPLSYHPLRPGRNRLLQRSRLHYSYRLHPGRLQSPPRLLHLQPNHLRLISLFYPHNLRLGRSYSLFPTPLSLYAPAVTPPSPRALSSSPLSRSLRYAHR